MTDRTKSILIIEDQPYQAELLSGIIQELRPNYIIDDSIAKVDRAIEYLHLKEPDLIFMDIELGDRLCFDIFDQINLISPVIYCTSHHEFAIEAFYKNGIHFLTKPTTEARVKDGIEKYELLANQLNKSTTIINSQRTADHGKFLLNVGKFTVPIDKDLIKYAYLQDRLVYIVTSENNIYTSDMTLDELVIKLDSNAYFRINRQYVVHIDLIDKYCSLDGGKIEVRLKGKDQANQYVSFKKRSKFLNWIKGIA